VNQNEILIVVAHSPEANALNEALNTQGVTFEILTTGVGGMNMSWMLQKRLQNGPKPKILINAGIAGSYIEEIQKGDIVIAASDCFADLGIDDNGRFTPLFSNGLSDGNSFPFTAGRVRCDNCWFEELRKTIMAVDAATVNMASGSEAAISRIKSGWNPAVETMEGAWFAYICMMSCLPWINIRAISNFIEPRNVKNWDIDTALATLRKQMPVIIKQIMEL